MSVLWLLVPHKWIGAGPEPDPSQNRSRTLCSKSRVIWFVALPVGPVHASVRSSLAQDCHCHWGLICERTDGTAALGCALHCCKVTSMCCVRSQIHISHYTDNKKTARLRNTPLIVASGTTSAIFLWSCPTMANTWQINIPGWHKKKKKKKA